jgi:hypothetical protein
MYAWVAAAGLAVVSLVTASMTLVQVIFDTLPQYYTLAKAIACDKYSNVKARIEMNFYGRQYIRRKPMRRIKKSHGFPSQPASLIVSSLVLGGDTDTATNTATRVLQNTG